MKMFSSSETGSSDKYCWNTALRCTTKVMDFCRFVLAQMLLLFSHSRWLLWGLLTFSWFTMRCIPKRFSISSLHNAYLWSLLVWLSAFSNTLVMLKIYFILCLTFPRLLDSPEVPASCTLKLRWLGHLS